MRHRYPHDWNATLALSLLDKATTKRLWRKYTELSDGEATVYGPDPYYKDSRDDQFQIRRVASQSAVQCDFTEHT